MVSTLRFVQINLHKASAAAAVLSRLIIAGQIVISLIQELWVYRGRVRGLNVRDGQLHYCTSVDRPRACILVRGVAATPLVEFSRRDLAAIKLEVTLDGRRREIVVAWHICPTTTPNPHHRRTSQDW